MNYSSKKAQILNVLSWSAKDWIDTYYFDESGFSLDSNIPYYWSPIGKPVEIPSNRFAKRINVLGFLNTKNNHLFSKTTITKVDTQVVIDFFNDFVNQITKTTVVILDNASIHTSKLFKAEIEKWEKLGLQLLFLPPYSPELNKIEILWKHMKYHYHKLEAYLSFDNLHKHVKNLLAGFGTNYDINFKQVLNSKDALIEKPNPRLIFINAYKNKNKIIIKIKDNAGGIDEKIIDKICEPYFTTKHQSQGTGIGLFMTEEIIVKHMRGILNVCNVEILYENKIYKGLETTIKFQNIIYQHYFFFYKNFMYLTNFTIQLKKALNFHFFMIQFRKI